MTLRGVFQNNVVEESTDIRNTLCNHLKNDWAPTFWPKISPNKEGDDYCKHCKHDLIKCKARAGLRNSECGGYDKDKTRIINLREDYVQSVASSGGAPPDRLQT